MKQYEYNEPLYLTVLSSEFISTVLVTNVNIVFLTFVDTLLLAFVISSQKITESSTIRIRCLILSQIHVLGFQF